MHLTERLRAVADLTPACETLIDVGCDHGYLPIALLQAGRIRRAIAIDIRLGPLKAAEENVKRCRVAEKVELRLSDGLEQVSPGEAQTAVFAGMGGFRICELLRKTPPKVLAGLTTLILEPQTEADAVRRTLCALRFRIEDEALVRDRGKDYLVIRAAHGEERYEDEREYRYGHVLINRKDPALREYLIQKRCRMEEWLRLAGNSEEKGRLAAEKDWIETILRSFEQTF